MEEITYEEFINNILETRGRFGCGDEYHEEHHIKPRCMGGDNNQDNLIDLFAREHFIAHKLLAKENPENDSLNFAWTCMAFLKNDHHKRYELTPEEYEEAKKKLRKIIAKANARRVWSEESKQKLSNTISGENHPWFGRHHSEESRIKMSKAQKELQAGENNSRASIMIQFDKKDNLIKVWRYAKLASKELKIHYGDISRCANGFLKSAGGYHWKYLCDNKLRSGEIIPGAITLGLITEEEALKQLEQDKIINEEKTK